MPENELLKVKNLTKFYLLKNKILKAVNNINFEINQGQTLAIIGESGSGKTTIANLLSQLVKPTSGQIYFKNKPLLKITKDIQMIFQNPYLSLNPFMKVEKALLEPLKIHHKVLKIDHLLDKVRLPFSIKTRFPHELSKGQAQRVAIARALTLNPKFLICDEPIDSLDTANSQNILNLLLDLQKQSNLTYLFISHNLKAVRYISQNVAVMYLGKFLEKNETSSFFKNPLHPYSQALITASFSLKSKLLNKSPFSKSSNACLFAFKCPYAKNICYKENPSLKEVKKGHFVACHFQ